MGLQAISQTTYEEETRIETIVNQEGDTLVQMKLADAKIILSELLDKDIVDSLLLTYQKNDSLKNITITIQLNKINDLIKKNVNHILIDTNNKLIIKNKGNEISLLNNTIKQQKREIIKQKVLKIIGFTIAVVLPILVLLIL